MLKSKKIELACECGVLVGLIGFMVSSIKTFNEHENELYNLKECVKGMDSLDARIHAIEETLKGTE